MALVTLGSLTYIFTNSTPVKIPRVRTGLFLKPFDKSIYLQLNWVIKNRSTILAGKVTFICFALGGFHENVSRNPVLNLLTAHRSYIRTHQQTPIWKGLVCSSSCLGCSNKMELLLTVPVTWNFYRALEEII